MKTIFSGIINVTLFLVKAACIVYCYLYLNEMLTKDVLAYTFGVACFALTFSISISGFTKTSSRIIAIVLNPTVACATGVIFYLIFMNTNLRFEAYSSLILGILWSLVCGYIQHALQKKDEL